MSQHFFSQFCASLFGFAVRGRYICMYISMQKYIQYSVIFICLYCEILSCVEVCVQECVKVDNNQKDLVTRRCISQKNILLWLFRLHWWFIFTFNMTGHCRWSSPVTIVYCQSSLKWRHNERYGVSNHRRLDCLLNRLFRRRSKKTSNLRVTGLYGGNSPVTGEFPAQRASNAENVSI